MKKYILTFLIVLLCQTIVAQKVEIKGIVKDSTTSKIIEGAVVKAVVNNKMVAFCISDKKGEYNLSFANKAPQILINFRHLNYQEKTKKVSNKSQKLNALLTAKNNTFREIIVKAPDVRQRKDTVSFSVKAFQGKSDRSIEDVIKRLPGVQVAKSGKISYQGKDISKLNIEGLDMMGGKYSLATKTIKAKAVNRVEVMENYQEVKQLRGKEYSDEVAMNLKLKKEAKTKLMGGLELGGGYSSESWLGHLGVNAMAFKSKYQFLSVLKTNNFGESLRPQLKDHFGFSTPRNIANSLFSGDLGSEPPISANRYWRKHDLISSFNSITKLSENKTLKVGIDYLYDKSHKESFSSSSYFLNNQYVTLNEDVDSHYLQNKIRGNIGYYFNSNELYFRNITSFGGQKNDNDFSLTSNNNNISQHKKNKLYHLSNTLYVFKRTKKNQYGLLSSFNYSQLPENRLVFVGVKEVNGDFYQTSSGNSFSTSTNMSFSRDIGKYSRLSINTSFSGTFDNVKTHLQKNDTAFINWNKGSKLTTSISSVYTLISPTQRYRVNFSLPITLYNLNYKNDFITKDFKFNKPFVSPRLSGHYILNSKWKTEFNGGLGYGVGDISNFILQPIQTSYRQESIRSGILAQNKSMGGGIKLIYKSPLDLFFANASVRYSQNTRNIIGSQQFGVNNSYVDVTSKDIENKHTSESFSANGYISKKIRSLQTTFSANANYGLSFGKSVRQGIMTDVTNHTFSIYPNISSDVTEKVTINYSFGYSLSSQLYGKTSTTYHYQSHVAHISYEFLENVIFSADWDFRRQELAPKKYKNMSFFDCKMSYKRKKFEVELMATNLLNLKEYSYTIFSDVDRFFYRYSLRGREVVATVKFDF